MFDKIRKELSNLPNLIFASNDEKEIELVKSWKALILYYGFKSGDLVLLAWF